MLYVLFLLSSNLYSQVTHENIGYRYLSEIFNDADSGIIINNNNSTIEKIFENNFGYKIIYIGSENHGSGIFYSINNNNREIILEYYFRYDPRIIWHGEHIAEIIIPSGSPNTGSFYFNLNENILSEYYSFPMYYDVENNYVLIWGEEDFELYDIETNELIRNYNNRRNAGLDVLWPFIGWYIEKINNNTIKLYWEDWDNNRGEFIIEL